MTRITNDELEKCGLNFSRCAKRDVAPLTEYLLIPRTVLVRHVQANPDNWAQMWQIFCIPKYEDIDDHRSYVPIFLRSSNIWSFIHSFAFCILLDLGLLIILSVYKGMMVAVKLSHALCVTGFPGK